MSSIPSGLVPITAFTSDLSCGWSVSSLSADRPAGTRGRSAPPAHLHQASAGAWGGQQQAGSPATFTASRKVRRHAHPAPQPPGAPAGSFQASMLGCCVYLLFPSFPIITDSQRHVSFLFGDGQDFPEL